jgi:hypothetical protein
MSLLRCLESGRDNYNRHMAVIVPRKQAWCERAGRQMLRVNLQADKCCGFVVAPAQDVVQNDPQHIGPCVTVQCDSNAHNE